MSKILFIIDHLGCGGAERITLQLAEYLAVNDHTIHLAVLNGRLNYYHCTANVAYTDLQLCESFAYGKMWKNKVLSPDEKTKIDILLNNNFDLIITGYNNGHWLTDYLKGNVWHWIHGDLLEKRNFKNPLKKIKEYIRFKKNKRKFFKLFSQRNLITVNRDLENKAQLYTRPNQIITIANGVDIPSNLLNQYSNFEKKWDVIFVGRLVPIKQVDHAIKAFAMSNINGKMAIVGDGPERQKLEVLTKELNISDRVDFLGWVENPHQFMLESKCLVMCSLYEGSPVTLAEAIALGIPIFSYNSSSGIQDLSCPNCDALKLSSKQNINLLAQNLSKISILNTHYCKDCHNKIHLNQMSKQILKCARSS
jgi:glycosyltransferase involved in cell wall biosynthesis